MAIRKRREKRKGEAGNKNPVRTTVLAFSSPKEPHCRLPEQICKSSNIKNPEKHKRKKKRKEKRILSNLYPISSRFPAVIVS